MCVCVCVCVCVMGVTFIDCLRGCIVRRVERVLLRKKCAIPRSVYKYCVSKCAFCSVHVNPAPVILPLQSHYCTASKPPT